MARLVFALTALTTSLSIGLRTEMKTPSWRAGAWAWQAASGNSNAAARATRRRVVRQSKPRIRTAYRAAATMHSPHPPLPILCHRNPGAERDGDGASKEASLGIPACSLNLSPQEPVLDYK